LGDDQSVAASDEEQQKEEHRASPAEFMSGHSSDLISMTSTLSSHGEKGGRKQVDDTTQCEGSELDESFDMEDMSSNLQSSLRLSLANPDADVREAAHRLLPFMDKIGEGECGEVDEAQDFNDESSENYGALPGSQEFPSHSPPPPPPMPSFDESMERSHNYGAVTGTSSVDFPAASPAGSGGNGHGAARHHVTFQEPRGGSFMGDRDNNDDEEATSGETTSLLRGSSNTEKKTSTNVQLRPSIFN